METFALQANSVQDLFQQGYRVVSTPQLPVNSPQSIQFNEQLEKAVFLEAMEAKRQLQRMHQSGTYGQLMVENALAGYTQVPGNAAAAPTIAQYHQIRESLPVEVREAYEHRRADFRTLLDQCTVYELIAAFAECSSCADVYTYTAGPRDDCRSYGGIEIIEKKGSGTESQPLKSNMWFDDIQLGESVDGSYCVDIYGVGVSFDFRLLMCQGNLDLRTAGLNVLARRIARNKALYNLKLWAGKNGFNETVFGASMIGDPAAPNDQYVTNNPPLCTGDFTQDQAIVKAVIKKLNNREDRSGNPICEDREIVFVTGSWDVYCCLQNLLNTQQHIVETQTEEGGAIVRQVVSGFGACGEFTVCYDRWLRHIQTGVVPEDAPANAGQQYHETAWAATVRARPGYRNPIEMAPLRNFANPVLIVKDGNVRGLSGGFPMGRHAQWGNGQSSYGALIGYGGAVKTKEYWCLSRGDGMP